MDWPEVLSSKNTRFFRKTDADRSAYLAHREMYLEREVNGIFPKFHREKPGIGNELKMLVRHEAQRRNLERDACTLLCDEELGNLWDLIVINLSPNVSSERINYESFGNIEACMPPKARPFFQASVYMKFAQDKYGTISAKSFFHYVVRRVNLHHLKISLSTYDEMVTGFLNELEVENYIEGVLQSLTPVANFNKALHPFYVVTAARKFFFFLDPLNKGTAEESEEQSDNWFSPRSVIRIYGAFVSLDTNRNHMLSKKELSRFNDGSLTNAFMDRLFQEYLTSADGEMGYKEFLDFILAVEYKRMPQAIQYFWRILDLEHKGYITLFTLNYFFRDVIKKLMVFGQDHVRVEDVANELFDMIHPKDPYHITLDDLISSSTGHTLIDILTDVNGFWSYENRESEKREMEDI